MPRRGQIVNRESSGGLSVSQVWQKLLFLNEVWYGCGRTVMDDQDITAAMFQAFPDRRDSEIFRDVVRVRNRYNRGRLAGQLAVPTVRSYRYEHMASGAARRITARGRTLPPEEQRPTPITPGDWPAFLKADKPPS